MNTDERKKRRAMQARERTNKSKYIEEKQRRGERLTESEITFINTRFRMKERDRLRKIQIRSNLRVHQRMTNDTTSHVLTIPSNVVFTSTAHVTTPSVIAPTIDLPRITCNDVVEAPPADHAKTILPHNEADQVEDIYNIEKPTITDKITITTSENHEEVEYNNNIEESGFVYDEAEVDDNNIKYDVEDSSSEAIDIFYDCNEFNTNDTNLTIRITIPSEVSRIGIVFEHIESKGGLLITHVDENSVLHDTVHVGDMITHAMNTEINTMGLDQFIEYMKREHNRCIVIKRCEKDIKHQLIPLPRLRFADLENRSDSSSFESDFCTTDVVPRNTLHSMNNNISTQQPSDNSIFSISEVVDVKCGENANHLYNARIVALDGPEHAIVQYTVRGDTQRVPIDSIVKIDLYGPRPRRGTANQIDRYSPPTVHSRSRRVPEESNREDESSNPLMDRHEQARHRLQSGFRYSFAERTDEP